MPQSRDQTADDVTARSGCSAKTVRSMEQQIQHMKLSVRYEQEMRRVHGRLRPERARELRTSLGKRHQQVMRSTDFHHFLIVIWKESSFVTDPDLGALDLDRSFEPGTVNSHSVGCAFAHDKHAVGAATQRAAKFGEMAAAYGLVERVQTRGKSVELRGTALLHNMFQAIGAPIPEALVAASPVNSSFRPT